MQKHVETTVQVFRDHPDASMDEILYHVTNSGIDRSTAIQLVTLLPLAYGRVTLSEVVFPATYVCIDEHGQRDREGRLDELPLWDAVLKFASQDPKPSFPIASHSSEIRAANEALKAGQKLKDLVWGPPVFLGPLDSFVGSGPVKSTSPLRQMWDSPAAHSMSQRERTVARVVMVVAILILLIIVGGVVYYVICC